MLPRRLPAFITFPNLHLEQTSDTIPPNCVPPCALSIRISPLRHGSAGVRRVDRLAVSLEPAPGEPRYQHTNRPMAASNHVPKPGCPAGFHDPRPFQP